ncbi:cell surface protein SprA [Flavobacterium sp. CYK-55]|uniref:T9SS outer membrane translocon Sov/SprA n=1 Tax=Flavobacterium sp. CYK-55 TaxID=2835529 RepID=UPI001BCBD2EA|nr:cell surface protein SprA [Flavobacterium sp. CYK-55]
MLFMFAHAIVFAQVQEQVQEQENDSIKPGYSSGSLELSNPPSILEAYTYDPATDRYIYTNKVDDFNINYPIILTPKEYEQLMLRESMRAYYKKKSDAIDGKKAGTQEAKKDLLPRYYVNSSFFESIFGSNTIDVKPTGSVEVDLGVRYTKQDNPIFSPRNRQNTNFDFNQRINMSLLGKVGTRLKVTANYDTQSTFSFQNQIKLEYTPDEDDIIQKIEVGNVSMPLSGSLIRGAQSLFGVKAQFQFGGTTITGVFSEQKSQTKTVTAQGGGTIQDFDLFGLDYDTDRHFFLSQYFRNKYDNALKSYPLIDSRVQITRLEVWITNRQNRVNNTNNNQRNIIALQDLGESQQTGYTDAEIVSLTPPPGFFKVPADSPSDNKNNQYDPGLIDNASGGAGFLNSNIREIATASSGFNVVVPIEGMDFSKLENARKLNANEFTFHPQLGYISLQQKLSNDEVLAVAYQYTIGDQVYQVGEFGNDGVDATQPGSTDPITGQPQTITTQALVLKMLKSNLTSVNKPVWNLMMKNIYQIPGAFQLEQQDFRFNILYSDPSPLNYITPVTGTPFPANDPLHPENWVNNNPLLKVFNVDRLNSTNDPQVGGDGFFDFLPGLTVDTQNGRLIFTSVEPFGKLIFEKLKTAPTEVYNNPDTYNANQSKYVFREMYIKTPAAALQDASKNKYELRGKFKSSGGDGIPIGAFNVPKGSVVVTAGGRVLLEGVDYTVNYQAGRVQILDPSLQASNTPIQVSVENNSTFGQQTRRFMGINIDHKFSDKLTIGGTLLKMTERPLTQKSNYGQESVNNTIYGLHASYATEVPFLTRMVNKLPFMDTDVPSNFSFRGEVAYLKPDTPKADQFDGESTLYLDDFEGSQTNIDLRSPQSWFLSSTPLVDTQSNSFDGETPSPYIFNGESTTLDYGFKRSKLSWYSIDPIIYTKPGGISTDDISLNKTRRILTREVYPNTDIAPGQIQVINTFDLTYYPKERGPYNNSTTVANAPQSNFGGIMRSLNSTNFAQANVEFIQFWMMDPYTGHAGLPATSNVGKLYFNLGSISEDILKDGRKQYENGLPESGSNQLTINTIWGKVPASQSLIYAFDLDGANRSAQDAGLDGMNDVEEATKYDQYAGEADPAGDNYTYFLQASGGVIERYKNYNGTQGNSPISVTDNNRGNTTIPDIEDINRDNTMDTFDAYFEYSIDIKPDMAVGNTRFVTDVRDLTQSGQPETPGSSFGETSPTRWIQFKIPVSECERIIGSLTKDDFTSIRFMRMFVTGFEDEITLRFASLDLIRGDWRRYQVALDPTDPNFANDPTVFETQSVNVLENGSRTPVKYVTPPGVVREQLYNNNTIINQNEQSLSLRVSGADGLEAGDSRGVFKNINVDMRQFKKLKMFIHSEAYPNDSSPLQDNEMVAFIRFGNDFTENFYQVEVPLKVTQPGATSAEAIWPEANDLSIPLDMLTQIKILMRQATPLGPNEIFYKYDDELDASYTRRMRVGVRGNPNFGLVRNMMLGIKNNTTVGTDPSGNPLSARPIKGEVWFNELRLAQMDNSGGMAAIANADTNLADFATISAMGKMSTVGFGALEQGPNERSREDMQQYSVVANLSLGKLMPKKWHINLPFNYSVSEEVITPLFDPFNQDIKLQQVLDITESSSERAIIKDRAIDYTKRKSINFIGVKKERSPNQKQHFYDPENLTLSYSFNQVEKHNFEIQDFLDQQVNTTADYTFNFQPKSVEPLKNTKILKKSSYLKMLSDFNFNYLPSNISFSSSIIRQYNEQQFRQIDVTGIPLDPLYRRNYLFNYQYGFGYNLTKSLKINYTASSSNIVRNFIDENGFVDNSVTLFTDYWNTGEPNTHNHQLVVNYELPLNKLPFLSFVKSTYSYTGDYNWQRASEAMSQVEVDGVSYRLGNTIQNAGSHKLNTALNMDSFYKYIGLTKKKTSPPKSTAPPKPGQKVVNTAQPAANQNSLFKDALINTLTCIKNININYSENRGTVLPGYLPGLGFFGTSKPTLGFIFGSQADVRYEAAKSGWLTTYPDFNQSYTQVINRTLNLTANVDLFPDFKIDLAGDRTYVRNFSEQYDVSEDGTYNSRSPFSTGNFSISTVLINTAFSQSDENYSAAFENFRTNRLTVANRLAENYYGGNVPRYGDALHPIPTDTNDPQYATYVANQGYPIGFGKNNQSVLIPAFMAAYAGSSASSVSLNTFRDFPIPNWTIKYTGLMRYKFFKDNFKRLSLQHGYKASYTVNSFRSNFEYDKNPTGTDLGGNFNNKIVVSNVNLVEQFNPLIRFDMEMKNSVKVLAELKKDRSMSLSFDNNLLTEVRGMDYTLGLGYRIKDVIFSSKLADNPTGIIKSDINIKIDGTYRNSKTIVRYLDYDNNKLSGGQNIWSVKVSADYSFSKNLTLLFYYDHQFSKAVISTSYPITNIRAGFTLRYNFGN